MAIQQLTPEQRAAMRGYLRNYVESITELSRKGGRDHYICPLCGSGAGHNGTGALSIQRDGERWKCFSCGAGGDIFDLIAAYEKIPDNTPALWSRAAKLYADAGFRDNGEAARKARQQQKEVKSITPDSLPDVTPKIKAYAATQGVCEYWTQERGLSSNIVKLFLLGVADAKEGKLAVIPYPNENYYIARFITKNKGYEHWGKYQKMANVIEPIFNKSALYNEAGNPVFIVEGQIDALSIIDAGGEAISINSTSGADKLLNILDAKNTTNTLILCMDDDAAGEKTRDKLRREFTSMGIKHISGDIYGGENDANAALKKDRTSFLQVVQETIRRVKRMEEELKTVGGELGEGVIAAKDGSEPQSEEYVKQYRAKEYIEQFKHERMGDAIKTGYPLLDEALRGGLYFGLYGIGAISNLGKTTFILQMADQIAKAGRDVVIFSLEMSRLELIAKSISRLIYKCSGEKEEFDSIKIMNHELKNTLEETIYKEGLKSYEQISEHIFIVEGNGKVGVTEVEEIVEQHIKAGRQAPVIVIDYLQILKAEDIKASDKQNTDIAVFRLKGLSRKYRMPVIAISSFNRTSYGKAAGMNSFKESGAIEYSCDVLLSLDYKKAYDKGKEEKDMNEQERQREKRQLINDLILQVLKSRHSRSGAVIEYGFVPKCNYFYEKEHQDYLEESKASRDFGEMDSPV